MKFIGLQRQLAFFFCITTLCAVFIVASPGTANDWLLDPLTGIVAASTAIFVCARLALGTPSRIVRQIWQSLLVLLLLICATQFAEAISERLESYLGLEDIDDILLLGLAPLLLCVSARFDPIPLAARRLLWIAFGAQLLGTVADMLDDGQVLFFDRPLWVTAADFFDFAAMQFYLLASATYVAALRWQIFSIHRQVTDIGDMARYLFVTYRLIDRYRYPRFAGMPLPIGHFLLGTARFLTWYPTMGPSVRRLFGVGLWQQYRDLTVLAFRHGLDAQAYYMFELYRPALRRQASGFLTRYETKNGLLKYLTWQIDKNDHRSQLGDKLDMALLWERHGIPCVPNLAVAHVGAAELDRPGARALAQDLFIKPRQSKGARGAEMVRFENGLFTIEDERVLNEAQLAGYLLQKSRATTLLVQPRIRNHPDLAELAEASLIVIRLITCLDPDGRPVVTHAMLRVLPKLEPEWPSDLELAAAVDLHTGTLGQMTGDKPEMAFDWHDFHPFTGARVKGRPVPHWQAACDIALAAHAATPDRLLIGWDMAISPDGPLLVEGNAYPDVDFLQRVHRASIGHSRLGPLLAARVIDLERRITGGTSRHR